MKHAVRPNNLKHDDAAAGNSESELGGYQLVDFGDGRKLESFAGRLLDRPCPAADRVPKRIAKEWSAAESVFTDAKRVGGSNAGRRWRHRIDWPGSLIVKLPGFVMPIQPTPFGHVGLFPEQLPNWRWLAGTDTCTQDDPPKALNLFGYTGASTIALAKAGFAVAHVDAAKPNVQACRDAASLNGLAKAPIRYLVDDAAQFVARELRRGNRYHTIVLDPPAYGHSPKGKAWRLGRDVWPLLRDVCGLLDPTGFRLLVTAHASDMTEGDIENFLAQDSGIPTELQMHRLPANTGRLNLVDRSGRRLDAGFFIRVTGEVS